MRQQCKSCSRFTHEDSIGYLVADLIGVAFADRLARRGKKAKGMFLSERV